MAETPQNLGEKGRKLEEEFFRKEDQRLIQRLRELREKEISREMLARASGIKNDAILDRLVQLGVHAETVAALAIVPLVEVAWADGAIDEKEKRAILERAEKSGIAPGSTAHDLLTSWLERRPEPRLLTAWTHMVQGLRENLTPEQVESLRADLVERAHAVARASGGVLGVGKVSSAEAEMIRQLEAAFRTK
jgi:Tellurite resistance protein TerB